jgi:hypothetical protein
MGWKRQETRFRIERTNIKSDTHLLVRCAVDLTFSGLLGMGSRLTLESGRALLRYDSCTTSFILRTQAFLTSLELA